MIQRLSAMQRKSGVSREAFSRHWRDVHGPLASKVPGLLRYQQNHVTDATQRVRHARGGVEVDGFAQLWFADLATMKEASSTPEYRAAFGDLPQFTGTMSQYAVETNMVMEKTIAGKGVKRMTILYAKEGMSLDRFRRHWFDEHAAMVAEFPGIRGYLQHAITEYLGLPPGLVVNSEIRGAGVLEMWFDDEAAMEASFRSPAAQRTIAHGDLFLGGATTYLVDEVRFV